MLSGLVDRHRHNVVLLVRFGMVGASGVIVNLAVLNLVEAIGPYYDDVWIDLPFTEFNVRWYHVYVDHRVLRRQPLELPAQPSRGRS